MSTPYTYFIKHRPTGYFYYGVQYGKTVDPKNFWTTYFTSSRYVHLLIETYGKDSFDVQIRKIFTDPNKALMWEQGVISRIRYWDKCLNKSLGGDALKSHKNRNIKDKDGRSSYDRAAAKSTVTSRENGWFNKLSQKLSGSGIGAEIKICEFCGKESNLGNYTRWHGENCKINPNITERQLKNREAKNKNVPCTKEQKEKLSKQRKGKVSAYDLDNDKIVVVDKTIFDTNERLVGITDKRSPHYKKRVVSDKTREKLSKRAKGRKFTQEHKQKLSESRKQRNNDNEKK